jgi:hypothetical protein
MSRSSAIISDIGLRKLVSCFASAVFSFAATADTVVATVPENLIPLTSSSAGCVAGHSSNHSGYPASNAFDDGKPESEGSRWLADNKSDNMFVTYKFKVAVAVKGFSIRVAHECNYATRAPKDWTFYGSNDGETWTELGSRTGETGWTDNELRYYPLNKSEKFLYYKFNCTANNGASDYMQVQELEFYGEEEISPVFNDLTTSSAGSAIDYTTHYASKTYNGTKSFDNGTTLSEEKSRFLAKYNTDGMYVIYKFNAPTAVNGIGLLIPYDNAGDYAGRAPNTWTFSGSNDGETWTTLDTRTGETGWSRGEFRHYEFRARFPFQYYKFNCTALNGATDCMQIIEMEFYYLEPDGPETASWTGAGETGSLRDAGNWDSGIPGLSTKVTIAETGNKDAVTPDEPMAVKMLYLGSDGAAVMRQTGAVFSVLDGCTIGRLAGGNGLLAISGGTFVSTNAISYIGARQGVGTMEVCGTGRAEFSDLHMGYEENTAGSRGTVRLSENGEFRADQIFLGYKNAATGQFFQTGGTCSFDKSIFVGYESGGIGRYEINGGVCTVGTMLSVGRYGTGTFIVGGPDAVVTIGGPDATGLTGVRIGFKNGNKAGTGTLVVTNGGKIVAQSLYRGDAAGVNQAFVTFDGGILQAAADTATFLNNLANIDLKAGGLSIRSEGHDLGITNCTFNAVPGAKISVAGGGTVTFTDTTVNLTGKPEAGFTFAETDGAFSSVPTLSGNGGWVISMSEDAKRIRIFPSGFRLLVR